MVITTAFENAMRVAHFGEDARLIIADHYLPEGCIEVAPSGLAVAG